MIPPSKVAAQLRHIASKLEKSVNPNKSLVSRDLRKIIAGMDDKYDLINFLLNKRHEILSQYETSGREEVPYNIKFIKIDDIGDSVKAGEKIDITVEINSLTNVQPYFNPFTIHIHGTWKGDGTAISDIVSGNSVQGYSASGNPSQGFADYVTIHINAIISHAFHAIMKV